MNYIHYFICFSFSIPVIYDDKFELLGIGLYNLIPLFVIPIPLLTPYSNREFLLLYRFYFLN